MSYDEDELRTIKRFLLERYDETLQELEKQQARNQRKPSGSTRMMITRAKHVEEYLEHYLHEIDTMIDGC